MKLSTLLTSTRFWLLVIVALLQILVVFGVIDGMKAEKLTQIVQVFLGGIVTVRTVDRQGDKKVEAAKIAAHAEATL